MSELKSPKEGCIIVGTYENIKGTARTQDEKIVNGKVEFEYAGETDIDWNSQETVLDKDGQRIFVDDEGNLWSESAVIEANKG